MPTICMFRGIKILLIGATISLLIFTPLTAEIL